MIDTGDHVKVLPTTKMIIGVKNRLAGKGSEYTDCGDYFFKDIVLFRIKKTKYDPGKTPTDWCAHNINKKGVCSNLKEICIPAFEDSIEKYVKWGIAKQSKIKESGMKQYEYILKKYDSYMLIKDKAFLETYPEYKNYPPIKFISMFSAVEMTLLDIDDAGFVTYIDKANIFFPESKAKKAEESLKITKKSPKVKEKVPKCIAVAQADKHTFLEVCVNDYVLIDIPQEEMAEGFEEGLDKEEADCFAEVIANRAVRVDKVRIDSTGDKWIDYVITSPDPICKTVPSTLRVESKDFLSTNIPIKMLNKLDGLIDFAIKNKWEKQGYKYSDFASYIIESNSEVFFFSDVPQDNLNVVHKPDKNNKMKVWDWDKKKYVQEGVGIDYRILATNEAIEGMESFNFIKKPEEEPKAPKKPKVPKVPEIPEKGMKPAKFKPGAWYKLKQEKVEHLKSLAVSSVSKGVKKNWEDCWSYMEHLPVVRNRKMTEGYIRINSPSPIEQCKDPVSGTTSVWHDNIEEHLSRIGSFKDLAEYLEVPPSKLMATINQINDGDKEAKIFGFYNKKHKGKLTQYTEYVDGKKGANIAGVPWKTKGLPEGGMKVKFWAPIHEDLAPKGWMMIDFSQEDIDIIMTDEGKEELEKKLGKSIKKLSFMKKKIKEA